MIRESRALRIARELVSLPGVTIQLSGSEANEWYRHFTKRHPRYYVIQNKRWGVALLDLPPDFDRFLKAGEMRMAKRKRARALTLGYRCQIVRALNYLDDIMTVNESLQERQGRAMAQPYFDRDEVRAHCEWAGDIYAVLDQRGHLKSYAHVVVVGEVAVLTRLLGHGDELEQGVMYLCLTEIVRAMSERKRHGGSPRWLMYDTFFGAEPGLRYFKERLGFRPYRVRWKLVESAAQGNRLPEPASPSEAQPS